MESRREASTQACKKPVVGETAASARPVCKVIAEAEGDVPVCWICLDGPSEGLPLTHACRCPGYVHSACLARWQLQSAGTRREHFCDFCDSQLPDWKAALCGTTTPSSPAVMNVNFDGKTYSFEVLPGPGGYRLFTEAIRKAFRLPQEAELNITFTCDEPSSGSLLTLQGAGAYDAAVHCASVSATRRATPDHSDCSDSDTAPQRDVDQPWPASSHMQALDDPASSAAGTVPAAFATSGLPGASAADTHSAMHGSSRPYGGAAGGSAARARRAPGLGRKLRTAFTDLLTLRA